MIVCIRARESYYYYYHHYYYRPFMQCAELTWSLNTHTNFHIKCALFISWCRQPDENAPKMAQMKQELLLRHNIYEIISSILVHQKLGRACLLLLLLLYLATLSTLELVSFECMAWIWAFLCNPIRCSCFLCASVCIWFAHGWMLDEP